MGYQTDSQIVGSRAMPRDLSSAKNTQVLTNSSSSSSARVQQRTDRYDPMCPLPLSSSQAQTTVITTTTTHTTHTTTEISPAMLRCSAEYNAASKTNRYPLSKKSYPADFEEYLSATDQEQPPRDNSIPSTSSVQDARSHRKRKGLEEDGSENCLACFDDSPHPSKKARHLLTPSTATNIKKWQVQQEPLDNPASTETISSYINRPATPPIKSRNLPISSACESFPNHQQLHATAPPSPPSFAENTQASDSTSTIHDSEDSATIQTTTQPLPSPMASPYLTPSTPVYSEDDGDQDDDCDDNRGVTAKDERANVPELALTPSPRDDDSLPMRDYSQPSISTEDASAFPPQIVGIHINGLMNYFESLPEQARKFFIYQVLRRSDMSQLRFIADHVNPVLTCDFLSELPPELSLQIIGYLDAQSLCRAAQVSKTWRALIDSFDKVWRDLLVADGYQITPEELERAKTEGWEYQGIMNYEKDMKREVNLWHQLSEHQSKAVALPEDRLYRKNSRLEVPNKRRKINEHITESSLRRRESETPEMGLLSLRLPHLYKTIYRRHYCVRNAWMNPNINPRHLAFRAHGRHVVTCLQFDDDKVLTGSDDTMIHVYDSNTGARRKMLHGHDGGVWALQYEGNVLVSGSTDRTVRIWDIEQGLCRHVFHGHTSTVRCLVIIKPTIVGYEGNVPVMMPKEPLIITGSRDTSLRIWKLPSENDTGNSSTAVIYNDDSNPYFLKALTGHSSSVRALAAHGDTLISGSYDSTVRVWKISTGECEHRLLGHTSKVYSVILDHKRGRCISGSMDTLIKVWSLDTGDCILSLEGHTSLVGLLDLNFDRLVSAAADSSLRIWNPESGHCKSTLMAHTGAITCFQHDDQKVISGSDRSLKLWNVKTGEIVKDLLSDLSGGWQVKFNERKCVAAVQRRGRTYIEILDFGAVREAPKSQEGGYRIVVGEDGEEIDDFSDDEDTMDD